MFNHKSGDHTSGNAGVITGLVTTSLAFAATGGALLVPIIAGVAAGAITYVASRNAFQSAYNEEAAITTQPSEFQQFKSLGYHVPDVKRDPRELKAAAIVKGNKNAFLIGTMAGVLTTGLGTIAANNIVENNNDNKTPENKVATYTPPKAKAFKIG